MAGAEIIASAIGILLLVLVSYVLVGSNLTSADIIASAQKDMVMKAEEQMNTAIQISDVSWNYQDSSHDYLHFHITNTGSEIISNFNSTDVYVAISGGDPVKYTFDASSSPSGHGSFDTRTWAYYSITPDNIHPGMLDPEEVISILIYDFSKTHPQYMVQLTTPNGVSATYIV